MKPLSLSEKKFINCVWKKIHLLEFEKHEQELVNHNKAKYFKQSLNLFMVFILGPLLVSTLVILILGLDQFTLMIISVLLLSTSTAHEFIADQYLTGDN